MRYRQRDEYIVYMLSVASFYMAWWFWNWKKMFAKKFLLRVGDNFYEWSETFFSGKNKKQYHKFVIDWMSPWSGNGLGNFLFQVFIYNGNLHIIPIPKSPADVAAFPHTFSSVGDAVECIRTYSEQTKASLKVQTTIQNRLKRYIYTPYTATSM